MKLSEAKKLEYGDIPKEEVPKATTMDTYKEWVTICDCKGNVISAVRAKETDWYLWTIKNLVTSKEHRGKGLGPEVVKRAMNESIKKGAKAFAADITYDNTASLRVFEKLDFKPVTEFCWAKGEKPAYIIHQVFYPPTKNHKCPK